MLLTKTDYARHVKLSPGRITQLLAKGLPTVAGKIDSDVADAWIEANIDHDRRERERERQAASVATEPTPVRVETSEARRQKLQADAGLAKLKLRERDGALIARDIVERFVFERARAERDVWIGWIARMAPALAHELQSDPQATFAALDRIVREHLLEISQSKGETL
jgi:hypothetical protein